jgi:hypothetical protein
MCVTLGIVVSVCMIVNFLSKLDHFLSKIVVKFYFNMCITFVQNKLKTMCVKLCLTAPYVWHTLCMLVSQDLTAVI